jgi:ribosomal protein S18 acetylase RimI-like enzyme
MTADDSDGRGYRIRAMTRPEMDFAVDLAAAEGWNPGLHDAGVFRTADPGGFLVGLLDGEPIGCISAVSYAGAFGFIGLYIVAPPHRGQGYGIRLWKAAMQRLSGHNVGLDGVVAQQENYRRSGFALAYRNVRFEGSGGGATAADHVDARAVPFETLRTYDRRVFPAERPEFLRAWIDAPGTRALASFEGNTLRGYGAIRPCRTGFKIGPLFADTPGIAEALYRGLSSHAPAGAPVYLDVPEVNPGAMALPERYGIRRVFETVRMYTGKAPDVEMDCVFGVTTFELG